MEDKKNQAAEEEELDVVVLTDEETGEEREFQICANATIDDVLYFAFIPADEESDEYVILRASIDGEDMLFESIDDDDEFEKVEDYFNDLLFSEVDYDEN